MTEFPLRSAAPPSRSSPRCSPRIGVEPANDNSNTRSFAQAEGAGLGRGDYESASSTSSGSSGEEDVAGTRSCVRQAPQSLHAAVRACVRDGNVQRVVRLLEKGMDANARDLMGNTALILAASAGEFQLCKELLFYGARTSPRNECQRAAFDYADLNGNSEIRELLLDWLMCERRAAEKASVCSSPSGASPVVSNTPAGSSTFHSAAGTPAALSSPAASPRPLQQEGETLRCLIESRPFGMRLIRASDPADPRAATVDRVREGSAAAKAGISEGDVLIAVAGRPVTASNWRDCYAEAQLPFSIVLRRSVPSSGATPRKHLAFSEVGLVTPSSQSPPPTAVPSAARSSEGRLSDPQSCYGSSANELHEEVEYSFIPGPRLGIQVNQFTGVINRVILGGQAEAKGVKDHWMILKINGQPYSRALMERVLADGEQYRVSFRTRASGVENDIASDDSQESSVSSSSSSSAPEPAPRIRRGTKRSDSDGRRCGPSAHEIESCEEPEPARFSDVAVTAKEETVLDTFHGRKPFLSGHSRMADTAAQTEVSEEETDAQMTTWLVPQCAPQDSASPRSPKAQGLKEPVDKKEADPPSGTHQSLEETVHKKEADPPTGAGPGHEEPMKEKKADPPTGRSGAESQPIQERRIYKDDPTAKAYTFQEFVEYAKENGLRPDEVRREALLQWQHAVDEKERRVVDGGHRFTYGELIRFRGEHTRSHLSDACKRAWESAGSLPRTNAAVHESKENVSRQEASSISLSPALAPSASGLSSPSRSLQSKAGRSDGIASTEGTPARSAFTPSGLASPGQTPGQLASMKKGPAAVLKTNATAAKSSARPRKPTIPCRRSARPEFIASDWLILQTGRSGDLSSPSMRDQESDLSEESDFESETGSVHYFARCGICDKRLVIGEDWFHRIGATGDEGVDFCRVDFRAVMQARKGRGLPTQRGDYKVIVSADKLGRDRKWYRDPA